MVPTTGLDIPVRPGKQGGAATVSGTDQLIKVIQAAMAAGDDDNPFQEVGLSDDIVFAIDSENTHGIARQRVRRILGKFSDRVALDPKSTIVIYSDKATPGVVRARFRVIDLETDEPLNFDVQLT